MSTATPRFTCTATREPRPLRSVVSDDLNAIVHRAATGDERAWRLLLSRFDVTIKSVARRHGLNPADREEVAQRTWLALVRHIGGLHSHPAIAGWLLTTARRECLKILASQRRELPYEDPTAGREPETDPIDEHLLAAERADALHRAVGSAPQHEQRLMRALLHEPALSYAELSTTFGIPQGSIGPTRGRCISRLRNDRHLAAVVHGTRSAPGHDLG